MIKSISPDIKYIGVDDMDLDLFEGQYDLPEGMAYNSYLILDEKVAVMDTVDARKGEEWLENLEEALGGRKPDYLVVHHMEPDHSGTILQAALRRRRSFSWASSSTGALSTRWPSRKGTRCHWVPIRSNSSAPRWCTGRR